MKTSSSDGVRHTFIGILNAQGDFWTPLGFESEGDARRHIERFWGKDIEHREKCLRTFKFVPVRLQVSTIEDDAK